MERRDFLKALAAGGALAAIPSAGFAAARALRTPETLILWQAGLPGAAVLGEALVAALGIGGLEAPAHRVLSGEELKQPVRIDAVLSGASKARIVGVMDDAAAVVFQAVAVSRGAGCLFEGQHRFLAASVRHRLVPAGADAFVCADPLADWASRLAARYAGLLGADAPGGLAAEPPAAADGAARGGLVSFVLAA